MTIPTDVLGPELLRAATLLDTDPAAAARVAQAILATSPGQADATLLLATALADAGDPNAALEIYRDLATMSPARAELQLEYGRAAYAVGDANAARASLERAIELQPQLADAWRLLSVLHAERDRPFECDAAYARYAALVTEEAHLSEEAAAIGARRLVAADGMLQRRLAAVPRDVVARRMRAEIAALRENFQEAESLLLGALAIAPGYARARFDLILALHAQQKAAPMIPLIERMLAQDPTSFELRSLQASALILLGKNEASIEILLGLLREFPDRAGAWLAYGHVLRAAGQSADTVNAYRRCAELSPGFGEAYFCLANLKTFEFTADDIAAMRAQLLREDLADTDRWHFEFALGKAEEDAGRWAESFGHYDRGNALRRASIHYDPDANTAHVRRTMALYSPAFFAARAGWGSTADDPIFVVGLPRSGSTLIEQILASHSHVEGTRELPDVPGFAYELGAWPPRQVEAAYPASVAKLTRAEVERFGERYLEQTQPHRLAGRPRFIDKMPNNFMNIGFIHLMLPNARIIDARRHPLGCGFANYKQHFQAGLHFTYSLDDIGRFYRDYAELMAHFDAVLPGRVHRVHYEHLVANPEHEIRRLLDYCGLAFEEQCLRFHETRRVVQTASSEQVRRPMYTDAVDLWRQYESHLGPLKTVLGDIVDTYPSAPGASG